MAADRLLLARSYTEWPDYGHDGVVVAIRSNLRWCSNGFAFTCWNGEVVRGAFIIDAHDLDIIALPPSPTAASAARTYATLCWKP